MTALFDEIGEHFPMGRQRGRIVPTEERISNTNNTPLGLTLRVSPAMASKWGPQPTTIATTNTTDGVEGEGTDETTDSVSDESW
ncbi:MAG: hypothetical protein ACRDTG_29950 [Pseudonocardiaceae bacterium]